MIIFKKGYLLLLSLLFFLPLSFFLSKLGDLQKNKDGIDQLNFFNFRNLKSGIAQKKFDDWLASNFIFRAKILDMEALLSFKIFGEVFNFNGRSDQVVIGKNQQLYEKTYINRLNGVSDLKKDLPMSAPNSDDECAEKLGVAAKIFKSYGIKFMLIFYPHKAWIEPEFIPKKWLLNGGRERAAKAYNKLLITLKKNDVPVFDGAEFFLKLKQNHPEILLYSPGSTHWTGIAACHAMNRILEKLSLQGDETLPPLLCSETQREVGDSDIARLLGLAVESYFYQNIRELKVTAPELPIGSPLKLFLNRTSFAGQLEFLLRTTDYAYVSTETQYYRRKNNVLQIDWNKDILSNDIILFDQPQASHITVNVIEFIEDLENNSTAYQKRKKELQL